MNRLLIVIILGVNLLQAQDTLYNKDAFMFSENLVLNDSGGFFYSFLHCTGMDTCMGKYKRKQNRIILQFDPCIEAKEEGITINCLTKGINEEVNVKGFAYHTNTPLSLYSLYKGEGHMFLEGESVFKGVKQIDSLVVINNMLDSIVLHPFDDQCREYEIKGPDTYYSCGCHSRFRLVLRRKKDAYIKQFKYKDVHPRNEYRTKTYRLKHRFVFKDWQKTHS